MRVMIVAQYFWPETVGAGVWLHELAGDLAARGHDVTMVTALPNYPHGRIFPSYRGRFFVREQVGGVRVLRTWIHATTKKTFAARALSFGSFCASAALGLAAAPRPDVIYCVLPPLPLGETSQWIARARRVPIVINLQDVYPQIAVKLGYLRNRPAIRFFERMERRIYRRAARVVVITESFREDLLHKGVPEEKLRVVPNWADAERLRPAPKQNAFRERAGLNGGFAVVYSGGLGHNSQLESLVDAAQLLKDEPYQFLFVGDGVRRPELERRAQDRAISNVRFLPFQPSEDYPQVLAASDVQVVSLHPAATDMSLPSKVFKIMASGRPILALARRESDLAKVVREASCGVTVAPDDPAALADAVRRLAENRPMLERMGENARQHLEERYDRRRCVAEIEAVLRETVDQS